MARARYFEVATDTLGRPVPAVAVNVYQPGTTTPIAETIYAADSGATTLSNPLTANAQGEILFYLAAPARVDLRWVKAGYTTESYPVDVLSADLMATDIETAAEATARGAADTALAASISGLSGTSVASTPAGTLGATNVQDALNELDTEKVPKTQTRTGAQAAAALTIIDNGATGYPLVVLQDDATHDKALLTQYHYGNTAAQSYGIDILNFPGARSALVVHQYDNAGPALWFDNCGAGAILRLHNTVNLTNAPGQDGTGPYIELQDHGVTIASLTKALVFSRLSSSVTQGDTPFTFLSTVGKALSVQQSTVNVVTLEVIKAGTGAGSGVDVTNAGTGSGIRVVQNGVGKAVEIVMGASATGVYPLLVSARDYGPNITTVSNGGTTLLLDKQGTGNGVVLDIKNVGTANSIQTRDASTTRWAVDQSGKHIQMSGVSVYMAAGTGTPEGVLAAPIGSTFHRTDGGAVTSFYVKESGAGNTGWVAK